MDKSWLSTVFIVMMLPMYLTHLHFDHCGKCAVECRKRDMNLLSKTLNWSNESHWEWATKPEQEKASSFRKHSAMQESGQLNFIKDLEDFLEKIRVGF
jgi:glyoxylase-like metal-dependent hydrolase (beta-lactamase superfamily II)